MSTHEVAVFDQLLGPYGAAEMVALCEGYGDYGLYTTERSESSFAPALAQRYDAAMNFVRSGGRFGRDEPVANLAARTNYFREEYVYGDEVLVPGVEPLLHHEGFIEAARRLHGLPVIEPSIVYANILVRGQELAVHTDVPEFRGANRRKFPQWLMVVMHHSGLFADWRMPISTGVAYFGPPGDGGEFAYYPDGPQGPVATIAAAHDTAVLLDTDTVFHGVDRVGGPDAPIDPLRPGMALRFTDQQCWELSGDDGVVATYDWADLRFSVSWKAYCFVDEAERDDWREHRRDLTLETILDRLVDDLRDNGFSGPVPDDENELGRLLIDTYIEFPPAAA